MAKISGKDQVTAAQVAALLAGMTHAATSKSAPKKSGFNASVKGVHALQGAVQTSYAADGRERTTLAGGPKGKSEFEITDPQTRKYLEATRAADAESAAMQAPRKHKQSTFNRIIDVLSRGNYAVANAVHHGQQASMAVEKSHGGNWKEIVKGLGAMPGGFVKGLEGKEKTRFHDVLQTDAERHGKKGGGFLQGAEGLALDIALDPTTYIGTGLVSKAATKSKDAVEVVNKAAKALDSVNPAYRAAAHEATAAGNVPVGVIKAKHVKNLTPEGKALYDSVISTKSGSESIAANKAVQHFKTRVAKKVGVDLSGLADDTLRGVAATRIDKELAKYPGMHTLMDRVFTATDADFLKSFPSGEKIFGDAWQESGNIRLNRDLGDRAAATAHHAEEAPGFSSITYDNPEQWLEHIVVHEMGHQASFHMPEEAWNRVSHLFRHSNKEEIAKELSTYGSSNVDELMAEAWAEFRLAKNPRYLSKVIGKEMEKYIPKAAPMKETHKVLEQLSYRTVKAAIEDGKLAAAEEVAPLAKAIHSELLAATIRNTSPLIKKELQIKIGPQALGLHVPVPLAAEAVGKGLQRLGSIPGIRQSVESWNKAFRASAYIPKDLNHLRVKSQGASTELVTAHLNVIKSIFNNIPHAQRASLMTALRDGAMEGNAIRGGLDATGHPVENVLHYLDNEFRGLDLAVMKSGLTPAEVNSFLGPKHQLTKAAFKEKVVGAKYVTTTDDLGRTVRRRVDETATMVNERMIYDSMIANTKIKDPAEALYLYTAAVNQAIAKRNMWATTAHQWGVPIEEQTKNLSKGLETEHGWVRGTVPGTEKFLFPKEIADGMQRMNTVFRDARSTGMLLDQFDKALTGFKSVVTRYNPSFHPRTFLGEMLLGYMGGMRNLPGSYLKAGRVIRGRNQTFMGNAAEHGLEAFGANAPKKLIQSSNITRGEFATASRNTDGSSVIIRRSFGGRNIPVTNLTADKIWHLYLQEGLKSGFASADLQRAMAHGSAAAKVAKTGEVAQALTEGVEDYGRLAHFIDILQHSKAKTLEDAVTEASMTVRKYHLDYTNVTHFEKNVMTRAIPFYKWIRLSTPVMAEILLTQPGKALMVPKTMKAIADMAGYDVNNFGIFPGGPDAVVPEWMRNHGAMPWGEIAGNTNYFDPTAIFPLAGSVGLADEGGLNAINPAFKVASDLYHGSDNFGNQLRGEGTDTAQRTHYAAAQTPQTNFAEQMITKRDPGIPRIQSLLQFLANPGNQPNTEKRMRGEAFRQRQEAYHHRKEVKKEKGVK